MPIEGLKEECGLFAVFGLEDAALHTALALHAQQHRGQEGAGIVTLHDLLRREVAIARDEADEFGA